MKVPMLGPESTWRQWPTLAGALPATHQWWCTILTGPCTTWRFSSHHKHTGTASMPWSTTGSLWSHTSSWGSAGRRCRVKMRPWPICSEPTPQTRSSGSCRWHPSLCASTAAPEQSWGAAQLPREWTAAEPDRELMYPGNHEGGKNGSHIQA